MKRKITFLLAALLLLSGLTWAQTDVLNHDVIGVSGTSYSLWSDLTVTSSAVYAGNTAGGNNAIQMRSNNNNSGIVTTSSAGIVSNITVAWNSNTNASRTLSVYGSNTAYTAASDLYGSNAGTQIGTINYGDTELVITDEYAFIGIRSTSGALYLDEIQITWTNGGTTNPSITASNVEIAYDATEGAIEYTINNGVEGGVLSAATEAEWLTIGTVGETVPFTSTVNDDGEREATITLTYTYNTDQTVTKNVTVTQANNPNAPGTENNPYTVAQARAAIDAGSGTQGVYATGIVSAIPTAYNSTYGNVTFNMVDEEGDEVFLQAYRCGGDEAANVAVGDVVVVYGNLILYNNSLYEFSQGCQVVSLTHPVVTTPTITVTPTTINAPAEGAEGTLAVTYTNITEVVAEVYFCDANGEAATYNWITANINSDNNVDYTIQANDGEARTAYLKVYALDDNSEGVYSNLVTVNQEAYVAPTYAELPFAFNSGKAVIEETDGLYQEGLGSDYSASTNPNTQLKFDGTGDWLLLQFDERPGTLTFDIKGNSFSGGTFTVQTSEDGVIYTDLSTYTELTDVQNEEFTSLGENVRYIKWIYTNKSSGNVGLGNITLAEYVEPVIVATITVNPAEVNVDAEEHDGTLTLAYVNLTITDMSDFDIKYYDAEGEEAEEPGWIEVTVAEQDPQIGEGYVVSYYMIENDGEARTAYFKVYAMDDETNLVYSNLVTINQAEYVAPVASITLNTNISVPAEGGLALIPVEYVNINEAMIPEVIYYNANEEVVEPYEWITVTINQNENDNVQYNCDANGTYEQRMAYFKVKAYDNANNAVYSDLVTITQEASVAPEPPTAGWVLTNLAELTENDVFVIVSNNGDNYAMSNDNGTGSAPAAVEVTVADEGTHLTGDIADNIQWTLSITENGYTFYPNGDTENWLYCTNTNNGVRVGTNDANVFSLDEEAGYLKHNGTGRYIGIYNSQDWRCYTSINSNITGQTFAFYKKVGDEPQPVVASITVDPAEVNVDADEHEGTLALAYENLTITETSDFDIQYYNADGEEIEEPEWIVVSVTEQILSKSEGYEVSFVIGANEGEARTAYFKVYALDANAELVYSNLVTVNQEAYVVPVVEQQFALFGGDLVEGDYIIYYDGYAMNNVVSSGRLQYAEIEPEDNVITTDNAAIIWHIAPNEEGYWTIYSADANAYAASTGVKNKAQMLEDGTDDMAMWTVTEISGTYEFVNKANAAGDINANLRNNGTYGFACYSTSTGGALSLYKYTETVVTYTMEIAGYGDSEGGYYLIASPVLAVTPSVDNGFLTDAFDLYYFDQSQEQEWRNYEAKHFNLVSGKGYLYASQESTTLTFKGAPYTGNGAVTLVKDDNAEFAGWNLVGNPFGEDAYIYNRNFYVMNETGDDIIASETDNVNALQGIFVIAENDGETIYFNTYPTGGPVTGGSNDDDFKGICLNITHNTNAVIDRVIVRFGEGGQLPKFQLNENNTKVYIPQGAEDFAVVRSTSQNEMPVNFKAKENGSYTISVSTENLNVAYLHLIDNRTGADIDLLLTPSYTFEANAGDNANRFRLVFNVNNGIDDNTVSSNASFAYFNGSEWVISNTGNATLQVVDMMGRVLSTEAINGNTTVKVNQVAGVYMLRLVNGNDVKVQKMVVK